MTATSNQNGQGKLALVTGGAKRIGATICSTLHEKGYNIVCTWHRSQSIAEQLVERLNHKRPNSAWAESLDLGNIALIQSLADTLAERHARLDILVNNASCYYPTEIGSVRESHWQELFDSNARGALFLCQSLHKLLKASRGSIVNLIDADVERAIPNHTVYSMAKAALAAMNRSLALELAPNVRVNAVAPGSILWSSAEQGDESRKKRALERCFLGRTGTPAEVAEAVWWLGERATYSTGSIVYADGGQHLCK